MSVTMRQMLEAGIHFGHQTRFWSPKIALDRPGAELLLGKGHLAAKLNGEQGLVFAQAPFMSDQDIEMAVDAICRDAEVAKP